MNQEIEGLYASTPERLPFAPSLLIRAFLLRRGAGNLLVYSTSSLDADATAMADLGGISRRYLNHWHEALFATEAVSAPLFVHEDDRSPTAKRTQVDHTFSARHLVDDDFEVIPISGHTRGATAYLWANGSRRFLFTGDSIYLQEGEWVAAVLESSDRDSYINSLELIRELDFDVLVPWAASDGGPALVVTDAADARRRIDAILERVRRGEDH